MSSWQRVLICLTVLATVALLGPASALAGGPSAGDQQYIDPLGGSNTSSSSHNSNHSSSSTSSSPTSTPSSSSPSSSTPSSPAASSTSPTASTAAITSSTATGTATSHADPAGKQLPFTGLNVGAAALLGALMLGGGVAVRRATRRV